MKEQIIVYGAALFFTISFARWGELFIIVGEKFLDFLPRWIITRFLYPIGNFDKDVQFYTRPQGSVFFSLGDVPKLSIYLIVINHSPFVIELDVLTVKVYTDSPHYAHLCDFQRVERTTINRHFTEEVFVETSLTDAQVRQVRNAKEKQLTFSLHITAFLDTKLGRVKREKVRLESLKAEISS
jgi:hypothetical protein